MARRAFVLKIRGWMNDGTKQEPTVEQQLCGRISKQKLSEESFMEMQTAQIIGRGQGEIYLTCRSVAPGLGLGKAWVVGDVLRCDGAQQTIGQQEIDREWN